MSKGEIELCVPHSKLIALIGDKDDKQESNVE